MKHCGRFLWLIGGIALGAVATSFYMPSSRPAMAASNDRFEDFILCTGGATVLPGVPSDGVWLLDYRTGKLLIGELSFERRSIELDQP